MTEVYNSEKLTAELSEKLKIAFQAIEEKSFDIATQEATKVLEQSKDEPNALFILALGQQALKNYGNAIQILEKLVLKVPNMQESWKLLIELLLIIGDEQTSEDSYFRRYLDLVSDINYYVLFILNY